MKIGLVLEGGASRTYFSCGAMDALLTMDIYADYVIGVSAGVSFGVSYCSKQIGRNLEILRKYESRPEYMGLRHLLNRKNRSYYNLELVFETIPNRLVPFDYKTFRNCGRCVGVVTRLSDGRPCYLDVDSGGHFDVLKASCALPILFQPIEPDGEKYMDGGIADSVPYKRAFEDGCDKVIVLLTREVDYIKGRESTTPLIKHVYRRYPEFVECFLTRPERYNKSIAELRELQKAGKTFVIAPPTTHGIGRLEKKPSVLEPFYHEGFDYTMKLEQQLREFLSK